MGIMGLTDRPILRRDGKIRAGYKDEANRNKLVNTAHFLLHDAPQLINDLGEEPLEIYFTVFSDSIEDFLKADLRWYNASQLLCMSMHGAPGPNGPMGQVAAYMGMNEVPGMRQEPFPFMNKSRVRSCAYKQCPQYMQGMCSEHMFLDIIIPQYSMGAVFTLDSVSINAILNASSAFQKAYVRYGGKLSGQIFKLCKKEGDISYQTADGKTGKRKSHMVHVELVDFAEYEAKFGSKVKPDDWQALMALRNRMSFMAPSGAIGMAANTQLSYEAAPELAAPAAEALPAATVDPMQDPAVRERANHPAAAKFFEELSAMTGTENSEDNRKKLAVKMATVEQMTDYLKKRIADVKKKNAATQPQVETPPAQSAPAGEGNALY